MSNDKRKLVHVPLEKIIPTKDNPRIIVKGDPRTQELSESIKKHGVLEPGLARPHPKKKGFYDLRAGERRYEACKLAGLETMSLLCGNLTDRQALEVTIAENMQREDLTPLEEARGVQTMLDRGWDAQDAAEHLGKSAAWIVRRAQISKLSEKWKKALLDPKSHVSSWPVGHLELVSKVEENVQDVILSWAKDAQRYRDHVTFKDLEEVVGSHVRLIRKAKFDPKDEKIIKNVPSCIKCQKRSACRPGLFDDFEESPQILEKNDRCLDSKCWDRKIGVFAKKTFAQLKKDHKKVFVQRTQGRHWNDDQIIKGDDFHSWEYSDSKKGAKNAIPVIVSNGPEAGLVRYVKPGKEISRSAKKKSEAKKKTPSERGNPGDRKKVADEYSSAWLCFTWASHVINNPKKMAKERRDLLAATASSLVSSGAWSGARMWFVEELELDVDQGHLMKKHADVTLEIRLLALGLSDMLCDEVKYDFPKKIRKEAASTFVPPLRFFEEHRKIDVYLMAKVLGIEVKGTMKAAEQIKLLRMAKLQPGKLTKELTEGFGLEWKEDQKETKQPQKKSPKKNLAKKKSAKKKAS